MFTRCESFMSFMRILEPSLHVHFRVFIRFKSTSEALLSSGLLLPHLFVCAPLIQRGGTAVHFGDSSIRFGRQTHALEILKASSPSLPSPLVFGGGLIVHKSLFRRIVLFYLRLLHPIKLAHQKTQRHRQEQQREQG